MLPIVITKVDPCPQPCAICQEPVGAQPAHALININETAVVYAHDQCLFELAHRAATRGW